jgi:hypothetical protein
MGGGEGGRGAKSCDWKKEWSSINHSKYSLVQGIPTINKIIFCKNYYI